MTEKVCLNCLYWEDTRSEDYDVSIGNCTFKPIISLFYDEFRCRPSFKCVHWKSKVTEARKFGLEFIEHVKEIVIEANKCSDVSRRAHRAAFGILTMLDGSGESFIGTSNFHVHKECKNGAYLVTLDFMHHDL